MWNRVIDKLPEQKQKVLVYIEKDDEWREAIYEINTFWNEENDAIYSIDDVTHWMIPKTPK